MRLPIAGRAVCLVSVEAHAIEADSALGFGLFAGYGMVGATHLETIPPPPAVGGPAPQTEAEKNQDRAGPTPHYFR